MTRIKRGVVANRRHKKVLKEAKGYYGARSRVYRVAKQAVIAGQKSGYFVLCGLLGLMLKPAKTVLATVN